VEVPPLRERSGDIDLLAQHFFEQFRVSLRRGVTGFGPGVMEVLRAYRWRGNVRELRNVVERMVLLSGGKVLTLDDVPADLRAAAQGGAEPLRDVERRHVLRVLEETGGNKRRAAQRLGIDRSTLYAMLKRYGVKK
jgi:DNA-binding NtrC family response regulator